MTTVAGAIEPAPSRRFSMSAVGALVLFVIVVLPFSQFQLGASISFVPAMLAIVGCFDVMSVYLLAGDYRDNGDRRVLILACAYVWSLVVMLGYALTFPGALSLHPPLTQAAAPWMYILWHAGFPTIIGLAWSPWPPRWTALIDPLHRRNSERIALAATFALATVVVVIIIAVAAHLPRLINGLDTSRMTSLTAPVTLPLVLVSAWSATRGTRGRTGPERWSSVAVLACLGDLVVTYLSRYRFSLGWYAGRTLTLVAAGAVLTAMLISLKTAKSRAQNEAMTDALTGLHNRRSGYRSLHHMLAHARRVRGQLSVISFDIDNFKQINDRYGHERGDVVLEKISASLQDWLRAADVAARIGGEEFLVILPDTNLEGARLVAERIREGVLALRLAGIDHGVSVSVGVALADLNEETPSALLGRVDAAVYSAKHHGRNMTVLAAAPRPSELSANSVRQADLPS